jgi:hypothetical protein
LVVVGVGQRDEPATFETLAAGLFTATKLVRRGGKIVVLSRASGRIGPALKALSEADNPRDVASLLRNHESADDYLFAHQLAASLAWADIFLLSALSSQVVEDMFSVALETPEQARRLVAQSASCLFVSRADLTSAVVSNEDED